jgi:hypothetical protein
MLCKSGSFAITALALALAAPASAQAAWSAPVDLSAGGRFDVRSLDSDQSPNGRAVAVWTYAPRSNRRDGQLFASVAPRTSGFGAARSMSLALNRRAFFRAAMSDGGEGLVVFQERIRARPRGYYRIRAMRLLASGDLGPPATLSTPGVDSFTPQVTDLPGDRFAVTWRTRKREIQVTKVRAGRRDEPVQTVGDRTTSESRLDIASAGENVAVVYVAPSAGSGSHARLVLWPQGARPTASQSLGDNTGFPGGATVRGAGSTFAVATLTPNMPAPDGGQIDGTARVQRFSPTGPLEPVTSYRGLHSQFAAIGAGGHTVLVWSRTPNDGRPVLEAMTASAPALGAPFGPETRLTDGANLPPEPLALNARGDTLVTYTEFREAGPPPAQVHEEVRAALRPVGGRFSAPADLGPGGGPTAVLRDDGSALVLFHRGRGPGFAPATAVYTP